MGLTRPRAHQLQDSDYKQSVRLAQSTNVTLSGGAPATVDGSSLGLKDRVLVLGQTDASENGIYTVSVVGSGSNGTWVRASDADHQGDMTSGLTVKVTEGTAHDDTTWKLTTDDPITLGSTDLAFELASAYAFGQVNAGGTTLTADQVNDLLTVTAGTNITVTGNASTDTATIATVTAPTFTGNVTAGNLTTAGALNVGEVTSDLIPDADVTRDLGSPTKQWHSAYVGPGSLYINGQKVLEESSGTIVVGADENQNISITTTGTGDIEFNPGGSIEFKGNVVVAAGKTMSQAGGAASEFSAGVKSDSLTSRTADTNLTLSAAGTGVVNVNDNLTVSNDVTVTGNLTVNGATTTVSTTNTTIEDALLLLSLGTTGTPTKDSGLIIERGSSINTGFIWDESADEFAAITTSDDATTEGDVSITAYANLKAYDITANSFIGDGSQLTGLPDTYTDSDVGDYLPTYTGNLVSLTGAVTTTANVSGGNLTTGGQVVATGNVSGGNLITSAKVVSGSLETGDITIGATKTLDFGSNKLTNVADPVADQDAATKNYVDTSLSSVFTVSDGSTTQVIADGDTLTFAGTTNEVTVAVSATDTVTIGLPDDVTLAGGLTATTTVAATGNVSGGNLNTGAQVVATGNVTGGNLITGAQVVATGNITGGNIAGTRGVFTNVAGTLETATQTNITSVGTLTALTATGNVTGGNLTTGAQVVATGNITGGNLISNADVDLLSRGELKFYDADSSNYVSLRAGSTVASDIVFTLPVQDGTTGQVLQTDGSRNLSFVTASGGEGGGASGYQSSTITTHPSAGGDDKSLGTGADNVTEETPFEAGGTDPFGVSLGIVYDQMEPIGAFVTIDLGDEEAHVGA